MCARATDDQEGRSAQSGSADKSLREPEVNRYEFVQELDEGSYGCVFACVQRPSGRLVAVKVCKHTEDPVVRRLLLREVGVLRSLPRHPCVVELLDAFRSRSSGRPHLVFECMERSAQQELEALDDTRMCPVQLKLVAWQVVMGLAHCHRNNVIHRDLKPGNILLAGKGAACNAKLCDFGFARNMLSGRPDMQERLSSYVVTRWYRAPEILVGDKYGMASDVWALGCTLAELSNGGLPLLPGTSSLDQLARIMRCCGPLPPCQALCLHANRRLTPLRKPPPRSRTVAERLSGVDPALVALVTACLQTDPALRPTARRLLAHPYFADVPRLLRGSPLQAELMAAAAELQPLATPLGPQLADPIPGVAGSGQTTSQQLRELQQWATQRRLLAVTATAAAEAAAAAAVGGTAGPAPHLNATGVAVPAISHADTSASGPSSDGTGAARTATEATPSPVAGAAAAVPLPPVPPQGVVARALPFIAQAVSSGSHTAAVSMSPAAAAGAEAPTARATGPVGTTTASPWTSAATAATAARVPPVAVVPSAALASASSAAAAHALGANVLRGDLVSRGLAALAAAPGAGATASGNNPYARVSGEPAWAVPSRSEGVMQLQTQNSTAVNAESVAVNALSAPLACHGSSSSSSSSSSRADDGAEATEPRSSRPALDTSAAAFDNVASAAAATAAEREEAAAGMQTAAAASGSDGDGEGDEAYDDDDDGGTFPDEEDADTPTAAAPAAGQARNALRRRAAVTGFLLDSGLGGNGGSGSNGSRRFGGTIPVFAVSSSPLTAAAGDAAGMQPGAFTGAGLMAAAPGAASNAAGATGAAVAPGTPADAGRAAAAAATTAVSAARADAAEPSAAVLTVAAATAANATQPQATAAAAAITLQQSPVLPDGGLFGTLCSSSSVLLAQLLGTNSPLPGSAATATLTATAAPGLAVAASSGRAAGTAALAAAVLPSTPVLAPPSSPRRDGGVGVREHDDETDAVVARAPVAVLSQHQLLAPPPRGGAGANAEPPQLQQQHMDMHMLAQHRSMCKRFASRSLCHVDCPPPPAEHAAAAAGAAAGAAATAAAAPAAAASTTSAVAGPESSNSVPLPAAVPLSRVGAAGPPTAGRAGYTGRALSSSGAPAGAALSSTTFGGDGGLLLLQQEQRPPLTQQQLDVERPSPAGLPAAMREAVMLQEQARRMRQQQQQHNPEAQRSRQQQQQQRQSTGPQQRAQGQQLVDGTYGWSFVAPLPQAAAAAAAHKQVHVFPLQDGARYYAALSAVAAHATGAAAGSAASAAATAAATAAVTRLPHERAPTPAWFDGGSVSTTGGRSSCGISNTAVAAVAAAVAATAAAPAPGDFGGAATPDLSYAVPMAPSALGVVDVDADGAASGRAAVSGHEWAAVGTFADGLATQGEGLTHVALEAAMASGAPAVSADDDTALSAAVGRLDVGGATKSGHQQGSLAAVEAGSGAPGAVRRTEKGGRRLRERVAAALGGCFCGSRQALSSRAL